MQYIVSKMSHAVSYCFWIQSTSANGLPSLREKITIAGGAGLPSIKTGFGEMSQDQQGIPMWTADGVVSPISEAQYEKLKDHPVFKKHLEANKVRVVSKDIVGNHKEVKKISSTLEVCGFAQLTPATYSGKVKVITNSVDGDDNRI